MSLNQRRVPAAGCCYVSLMNFAILSSLSIPRRSALHHLMDMRRFTIGRSLVLTMYQEDYDTTTPTVVALRPFSLCWKLLDHIAADSS